MKIDSLRIVLSTALLPLLAGGCAVQGGATADSATPAANPTQVAATAPPSASPQRPVQARPQLPPPSALETQYGIQITQVGVAASGGLVDLRFKVLDAAKARALLGNPANTPMLIVGDKPPLMPPHNALHGAKFGQGQILYILYPNLRNAITPGVEVTVAMGEARLGPIMVQ